MSARAKNQVIGPQTLRIVRGDPTQEELAAVTALIAARAGTAADEASPSSGRGRWNDPAAAQRRHWQPGPGGWRAAIR